MHGLNLSPATHVMLKAALVTYCLLVQYILPYRVKGLVLCLIMGFMMSKN